MECALSLIPDPFVRSQVEVHGERGREWIAHLPDLLDECARRWSLTMQPPFPNSAYNYVAPARQSDGSEVVLKAGVPHEWLLCEMDALQLCDGRGMVRLLDADRAQGVMLLERLKPGTPAPDLNDDERATSIAAQVMRRLWRPLPSTHSFPTIADWARGLQRLRQRFDGGTGPFPSHLIERAEIIFSELIASSTECVLLHGDLHHDNILAAEREPWLAIDPQGVAGERGYEVGAWLYNPMPQLLQWHKPECVLARRIDQFAEELELERERLLACGFAQAVLSAWWTFEDHGRVSEDTLRVAELLATLMDGRSLA